MKQLMPGMRLHRNPKNGFAVLRVHYTADEDKRSAEWKKAAQQGTNNMDWEREMEINFNQSRAKRAFPDYDENIHFKHIEINPYLVFHRSWDFGFRHPSCTISQIDDDDIWSIHRELLGTDIQLEKFIPLAQALLPKTVTTIDEDDVRETVEIKYKDYCDPSGTQRTDKSVRTSIEILHAHNIFPTYKKSNPEKRAEIIRGAMAIRPDKRPGMLVSDKCPITHAGFMGGFHFKENPTPGTENELEKEGYFEHIIDSLGYMAYFRIRPRSVDKTKRKKVRYVQTRFNSITGT